MSTIIIWILAVVGLVPAIVATRAYLLEKREGLPRSSLRFGVSIVMAAGLFGVAAFAQFAGQPKAPDVVKPIEHDAATKQRIEVLQKEISTLSTELGKKQAELEKLDPTVIPPTVQEAPQWPLMVAFSLVLFAFGALALGDLSTLLPKKRKKAEDATADAAEQVPGQPTQLDKPLPATMANLTAHATAGRYKAGIAMAAKMSIEQLHKLEQLDFLYLRAFCALMAVSKPEGEGQMGSAERSEKLTSAQKDLESLLGLAPHMAEAKYLLGLVKARANDWQGALDTLRDANTADIANVEQIPVKENESACLLALAEQKLAAADNEGATRMFDEVTKLGVLAGQIPVAMVTHRILAVREAIKQNKLTEAAEGIARIREVTGLEEEAQKASGAACDVYDVAIQYKAGELDKTLAATRAFFARWLPAQLPDVEDQVADEFLLPAIDKAKLPLPSDLYRALFFLEAVVRIDLASRKGAALSAEDVEVLSTLLLRALQFQPRHRDSLAALGALYLAYKKERTEKALAWLDAAITMGVRSPRARALLAEARRAEQERKELLAMFRSASARFLSDPAVGIQVRKALIEELGRFDEFRPVVLDLQDSGALDAPPAGEITVTALRERAAFVGGIASEVVRRADPAAVSKLSEIHRELTALANNVDTSATRIAALERAVMEQLGRIVLR
jgi:tetratricopeptide (TPR) repeat protein